MANFKDSPHFQKFDDYYTPAWVWDKIQPHITKDTTIYEACCLKSYHSKSPAYWIEKGYKVVYNFEWDFLENNVERNEYDIIITNIPFETEIKKKILKKLVELDKPFIIIMNSCNVFSNYFQDTFAGKDIKISYPRGKLHYGKLLDNGELEEKKNTSFYSCFVYYKVDLPTFV